MLWYTERYPAMPKGGAAVTPEYDGAFDALYLAHVQKLLCYAQSQIQRREIAEELVQDTFHEAYLQFDRLRCHENPGGWLMQTLKNKLLNYRRTVSGRPRCCPAGRRTRQRPPPPAISWKRWRPGSRYPPSGSMCPPISIPMTVFSSRSCW